MISSKSVLYFGSAETTNCYIMGGTNAVIASDTEADQETLRGSDPRGIKYDSLVRSISTRIQSLRPGISIWQYAYVRQVSREVAENGGAGYGKGAVST
jgi:hypothetical protein